MSKPVRCATCNTRCDSIKTPAECGQCQRRRLAGDFWSPDVLEDGRWVPAGGIVRWQRGPELTVDQIRAGHSAYNEGCRSPFVVAAERAYQRMAKRRQRAAA